MYLASGGGHAGCVFLAALEVAAEAPLETPALDACGGAVDRRNVEQEKRLGLYRLESRLASRGASAVYAGRHVLGYEVVVEVLPRLAPGLRERLMRQVRKRHRLTHPAVERLVDVDATEDGRLYVVTAPVEGVRLADEIDRGPLSLERVRRIGAELAEVLDHLHVNEVAHRDLNPRDIMLTPEDRPVLMGLGTAFHTEDEHTEFAITTDYVAPEQLLGGPTDERVDAYSLGVLLYEMLTGRLPLEVRSARNYLELHLQSTSPSDVEDLPPAVREVIRGMLDRDASRRPTMKEVTAALLASHPTDGGVVETSLPVVIHLNVWFPEDRWAVVTLPVGAAARLLVNLAQRPREAALASERVSEDAIERFYEVDHVDVMVLCPGADVTPLRARLPLPPDAGAIARFEITPRRVGPLELSVVLLIEGESVHRTQATIFAVGPARAVTEAAP